MKRPTLDEFIAAYPGRQYPPNLYVREKGFEHLYVRIGRRWFSDSWRDPTLDLANFEVRCPGKGKFTALVARLRRDYPAMTLYVETVLNTRFNAKLIALGFKPMPFQCYALFPENELHLNHESNIQKTHDTFERSCPGCP